MQDPVNALPLTPYASRSDFGERLTPDDSRLTIRGTAYFLQFAVLTALCLALYLPGLRTIPPLDRDEARFAQATRQMVQSGDFIQPHFGQERRSRKPIGIYWLQSLSVVAAGATVAIWPYRLPSVIGATLAVLLTLFVGRVLFAPAVALLGAALLAAAVLLVVEAHIATTDAALLAAVVAAQSCLGVLYASARAGRIAPARYALGFWIAQGIGILLKGPIAPLVSGLTIVTLLVADNARSEKAKCKVQKHVLSKVEGAKCKSPEPGTFTGADAEWQMANACPERSRRGKWQMAEVWGPEVSTDQSGATSHGPRADPHPAPGTRHPAPNWRQQLRPQWGVLVSAAIVLPWVTAIAASTGVPFYREWLGDVLPKLTAGHESHGAPPGSYLLMLPATFWPGSFAAGLAIVVALRRRTVVGVRFCLAWLVPTWIFFELIPTKLPHYVLPLYPALALLTAAAVAIPSSPIHAAERVAVRVGLLTWVIVSIAIGVGAAAAPLWFGSGTQAAALLPALAIAGLIVTVIRRYQRGGLLAAARLAPIGAALVVMPVFGMVLPELDRLWLSRSVARAIAGCCGPETQPRAVAAVGYHEPSLVFLSAADVALVDATEGANFLATRDDGLLVVAEEERTRFDQVAREHGLHVRELWAGSGFNYSKGKSVSLRLFERAPASVRTSDSSP